VVVDPSTGFGLFAFEFFTLPRSCFLLFGSYGCPIEALPPSDPVVVLSKHADRRHPFATIPRTFFLSRPVPFWTEEYPCLTLSSEL